MNKTFQLYTISAVNSLNQWRYQKEGSENEFNETHYLYFNIFHKKSVFEWIKLCFLLSSCRFGSVADS